jgi:hypothetical protein
MEGEEEGEAGDDEEGEFAEAYELGKLFEEVDEED